MQHGEIRADLRDHPLSDALERKVAARNAAIEAASKAKVSLCTRANANTVVLDPDPYGVTAVYLLSAPVSNEGYPLGGHYLYRIGPDGKVLSERGYMKSCLDMPTGAKSKDGSVPIGFSVTHVLDDHPTEMHYFVKRYSELMLMVMAGGHMWAID